MERDRSIDVAKGILMIAVIVDHISYSPGVYCPRSELNFYFQIPLILTLFFFVPFFMASFFVLHGYCSRYERNFTEECKYAVKNLLVPMLLLMQIPGYCWFCWAMAIAIVVYHPIRKIRSAGIQIVAVSLLALAGMYLRIHGYNWCYSDYALILLPFFLFGEKCKALLDNPVAGIAGMLVFLTIISVVFLPKGLAFLNMSPSEKGAVLLDRNLYLTYLPPNVNRGGVLSVKVMPLFYLLSVSGTLGLVFIARRIGSNRFLEYIGRNSLVFYLIHISIYVRFILHSNLISFINKFSYSAGLSVLIFFVLFVGLLAITTACCAVINRFVPWVTGKGL